MSEKPQMDEPPKKRRFWQLHLSTAVFTMLLAGFLIHIWFSKMVPYLASIKEPMLPEDRETKAIMAICYFPAVVAFLFAVAYICEWLIRRREGREP